MRVGKILDIFLRQKGGFAYALGKGCKKEKVTPKFMEK